MRNGKETKQGITSYAVVDYITAVLSWSMFFTWRKIYVEDYVWQEFPSFLNDEKFYKGVLVIPIGWLLLYFITGTYTSIYRKSRVNEITKTFFLSVVGVIILFFAVLIDDQVMSYRDYYSAVFILLLFHFSLTVIGRLMMLNAAKRQLVIGRMYFNTLFVGGNKRAKEAYAEINGKGKALGYRFIGYLDSSFGENKNNGHSNGNGLSTVMPHLGNMFDLAKIIQEQYVKQVIVAIESSEHHQLKEILNQLVDRNVIIKIVPDMYDILSGSVKMNHLLSSSFIEIYPELMDRWQYIFKRMFDLFASTLALIVLSPLFIYAAIRVKLSSPGPIIYKQERIGLHGAPFTIYKFRSMYMEAETGGPRLSSHEDERITKWGRVMRKWRMDELPQFVNVLKGEMSLVGPRPERKYYIEQILHITTDYKHLHRVQPGITSLGMVKFGYAENLDQMMQRMKYDLLYLENMSVLLDLKVMLYTLRTIFQGRGK